MKIDVLSASGGGSIQNVSGGTQQQAQAPPITVPKGFGLAPEMDTIISKEGFSGNIAERLKDPEIKKEFDKVLDFANKLMFPENSSLRFSRHEAFNTTLVKLVDSTTNEIITEFPPEKVLNVVAGLMEIAGLVVDKKA